MARKQVGAAPSATTDAVTKSYVDTRIFTGVVSPGGAVSASPGTLYIDTNAGSIWYKDSGTGTSGWVRQADYPYVDAMGNSATATLTARIATGTGTPEGVVTATVGSLFKRTDGASGTAIYVKETGTGNTGWVPYASKAYIDTADATTDGNVATIQGIVKTGTGTPEGVVTATVGTTFKRTDGAAGTALYVKETGTGNTGWVPYASKTYIDAQDSGQAGQLTALEAIVKSGTNSPEGVVTATVGSIFKRTNGGAGTSIYVKETGTGNTGWVPYASKTYIDAQDTAQAGQLTALEAIVKSGTGSPESVVTATVGSIFKRTDGGAGTSIYVKEVGTGNTGWQAYTSKSYVDAQDTAQGVLITALQSAGHFVDAERTTTQSIGAATFTTITMVDVTDTEGLFNGTVYTVPETGVYMCMSKIRCDSATAISVGQGVHTSNIDGPWFAWRNATAGARDTFINFRAAAFTAGDQLRLYAYSDGAWAISRASLVIYRIGG